MARRNNDLPTGSDKAKVRVVFAEVEGNNASVQEALRTMVSAMGRPARIIQVVTPDELPAQLESELASSNADTDLDREAAADDAPSSEPEISRRPRGTGQKTDRNAGIALVPDLNFRPDGHAPLRDFFSEKKPDNDMEHIVVVLFYLQKKMGLSKIGLGHIRTALNDVGKSIPLDMRQTLRNMRNRKAWVKYTDLDDITIATAGENFVLHDMSKAA